MKKVCLLLGAALLSSSAFAATRVLYSQDFENVADVESTGWTYAGTSISIASDDYGKFLELSLGNTNGRSGYVNWGEEIFQNADGDCLLEDGTYTAKFDFCIAANANNQYNTEITLFTNGTGVSNQPWRGRWSGDYSSQCSWLADVMQVNTSVETDMTAVINAPLNKVVETGDDGTETIKYEVDKNETNVISTGTWYTFTSFVNVNTREVEYDITAITGEQLASGSFTVPETSVFSEEDYPISMFAQGLWVMTARYNSVIQLDNFEISFESANDFSNPPVVSLVGVGKVYDEALEDEVVNLNARKYAISFKEGETLHVQAPGMDEVVLEYADVTDGVYEITLTQSGTLKAWTVNGDATSDLVEVEVDCAPVVLPAATATISAVEAGYGKTYTLSVSNTEVPMRPTIFINYKYVDKSGNEVWNVEGAASGVTVTVEDGGTLTMTTQAFGYQETTTSVENDLEFAVKNNWDFARMSQDDLTAAGFTTWQELNSSSTSGFNNWTARKRLFYYDANSATVNDETGETEYTAVYPFGYVSEDGPVLNYSEIGTEGDDLGINVAGYELFPGITVFAGHNVTALLHVGVTNNATSGGNNKNIDVLNLAQTDFVVYNTVGSYGSDSNHPVVETAEEYYAEFAGTNSVVRAADGTANEDGTYTVSCPIYRIDTVCTNLTVFEQVGASSAVEAIEAAPAQVVEDGKWYNLQGIQVAEPTSNGIYIHNGKKVMIRK